MPLISTQMQFWFLNNHSLVCEPINFTGTFEFRVVRYGIDVLVRYFNITSG
jgi:hypothetical protein